MKKLSFAILLIIAAVTPQVYAEEPTIPPLDLKIPKPLILKTGYVIPENTVLFAFTTPQYGTILGLGAGYKLWTENYPLQTKFNELWELKISIVKEGWEVCESSNQDLEEDRKYVSELFYKSQEQLRSRDVRKNLKIILCTTGGILVGGAIGIIIGAVAIN